MRAWISGACIAVLFSPVALLAHSASDQTSPPSPNRPGSPARPGPAAPEGTDAPSSGRGNRTCRASGAAVALWAISPTVSPRTRRSLLPDAKALMDARMAKDDPEANCLPTGVPGIAPYPWRIVQTPTRRMRSRLMTPNGTDLRMTALSRRPGVSGCDRCDVPDEGDASSFGCRLRPWREDSLGGTLAKHRDAFRRRPAGAPAGAGRDRCRALVEHRLR